MRLGSARQAIHDAYATGLTRKGFEANLVFATKKPDFNSYLQSVHRLKGERRERRLDEFNPVGFYTQDHSSKANINNQICHNVEAGMIINVVENLPEPFKSWAKWAYGPRTQEFLPEQGRFFRWLAEDVEKNLQTMGKTPRKVTQKKIKDVIAYTVLDYRNFIASEKHLYPNNLIISRCKIVRQNWKRDFEPWQKHYWNLCNASLDYTVLLPVATVVSQLQRAAPHRESTILSSHK